MRALIIVDLCSFLLSFVFVIVFFLTNPKEHPKLSKAFFITPVSLAGVSILMMIIILLENPFSNGFF